MSYAAGAGGVRPTSVAPASPFSLNFGVDLESAQGSSVLAMTQQRTADDVLRGIDLSGKLAIVTGGYSGLGLAATHALARAGAHVLVPARRPQAARESLGGLGRVEVDHLDLADLGSVRSFCDRFLASGRAVDVVIAGAGVMACPETRVGPGWEAQFTTNHLGHYALVNLLWPAIAQAVSARVVVVSSGVSPSARMRWDDIHFEQRYDKWQAYAQSKLANVLFAVQLDAFGRQSGVRAFSVNPGYILTPLQRHLTRAEMVQAGWVDAEGNPVHPAFVAPEQGAATQVWAATSPELAGVGGVYCAECTVVDCPAAQPEEAARLWQLSAHLTGIDAFAPPPARQ
jgi:NAD(P)-dependent dehydrogenase (short-subunit alcohol dehydrogenase family)